MPAEKLSEARFSRRSARSAIVAQSITGRKLMFIGNGASATISSHQSMDYWKNGSMGAVAFNDPALLACINNNFGYSYVFEKVPWHRPERELGFEPRHTIEDAIQGPLCRLQPGPRTL